MTARITTAIILAGGRSSRMAGPEKAFCRLAGRTMIDIVAARLAPQVERVVINANGDPGRFAALGLPVIADAGDSFEGPLAGVLAGLVWARATGNAGSHVVTVPVDSPFLPGNLVARLAVAGAGGVAVAASLGRLHPVIAAWPIEAAGAIAAHLAAGRARGVGAFMSHWPRTVVAFDMTAGYDPFINVNTPDELAAAEALATSLTDGSAGGAS